MQDTQFFEKMLGLSKPWKVESVELDMDKQQVVVKIAVEKATQWAHEGELLPIHGYEHRRWRHLDTMQFETVLEARVPRVRRATDDEQGSLRLSTEMVQVPWAQPGSRWTLMFEAWAVKVLQASQSVQAACRLLRLHWDSAHAVMQRAVSRGLQRRELEQVETVGLDEKSFGKGQSYVTMCVDLNAGRVLEVIPERTAEAGRAALQVLPHQQRSQVKAACIDMSPAYDAALASELPQALRVYDRFHVAKMLGEAVDAVRRWEHKQQLSRKGSSPLSGTRYLVLSNMDHLSDERFANLESLLKANLQTGKAYAYRIHFQEFWECADRDQATALFAGWYRSVMGTKLTPLKRVAKTLKRHLDGLLNYFTYRITNAMTEGLNSLVQKIKSNARGFRHLDHYRTRILFFLGNLDLLPQTR